MLALNAEQKNKHLDFNLAITDIPKPTHCPILGVELDWTQGNKVLCATSPSLDRIDNTKGYILGNIQVISFRANTIKNNATIEEIRMLLNYLENL